ncbi:hypothetical protein QGN29_09505 [Temperatibacter marinus]|uniref:Uncharacterized protein n=1 Tax=Temperatibacter marinus TaxID=1456591 RepID=A0AA52EEU7_9PROT|nr:hypothetical protein [Temperatibacter marinus]WND01788.1 hypothetical protein QGN29_09505 [Temperatibacter marinus]
MNTLSPREKNLWVNIIIDVIALTWFAYFLATTPATVEAYKTELFSFVAGVALVSIVIASTLGLIFSKAHELEDMDERDELIALKGMKVGYYVLGGLMIYLIGAAYLDAFTALVDGEAVYKGVRFSPLVIGNVLLVVITLSTLAKDVASLIYYRKEF